MKIVIQRVQKASVAIEDRTVGAINQGLLLLVGVGPEDTREDLARFCRFLILRFLRIRKKGTDQPLQELQSQIWLANSMTISINPCQHMFL